jgi:hypothetical protein
MDHTGRHQLLPATMRPSRVDATPGCGRSVAWTIRAVFDWWRSPKRASPYHDEPSAAPAAPGALEPGEELHGWCVCVCWLVTRRALLCLACVVRVCALFAARTHTRSDSDEEVTAPFGFFPSREMRLVASLFCVCVCESVCARLLFC